MNNSRSVSVVIPTCNRQRALEKVLPTYLAQPEVTEVILVIDGSRDQTRAYAESLNDARIRLFEHDTRRGAPYCRNLGMRHATGEFILVTDDDVFLDSRHVGLLLNHLHANQGEVIAGRRIYLRGQETAEAALARTDVSTRPLMNFHSFTVNSEFNAPDDMKTPFLSATMLVTRRVAQAVRYDEGLGGNAFREETDFQLSAWGRGYAVVFCPHTACFHLPHEDSIGGGQYSRSKLTFQYWSIRNHFRFLARHYRVLNRLSARTWSLSRWKADFLWYTGRRPFQAFARRRALNRQRVSA
jgi:glycosyltransferase involved in cell wall biosynthesis